MKTSRSKTAAHEEAGVDLAVLRDAMRDPVESSLTFRRDPHFDDRLDLRALGALVIDDRLVSQNHAVMLQLLDPWLLDFGGRRVQLGGQRLVRGESVFLQKT